MMYIERKDLIGLDECGVAVGIVDKHIGKVYIGGNYQKSEKWDLLLAISGFIAAQRDGQKYG